MTTLSKSFKIKALYYTREQLLVLKRAEILFIEPPPQDFNPQLQYLVSKFPNNVVDFLTNLCHISDKHFETFTDIPYETIPGGAIKNTQVKTYIFLFTRPLLEDGSIGVYTPKEDFV